MRAYRAEAKRGHTYWIDQPLPLDVDPRRPDLPKARSFFPGESLTRRERAETRTLRRTKRLKVLQPKTRAECRDGLRPCPWISCEHHLAGFANENGSYKLSWIDHEGGVAIEQMPITCAADAIEVAEEIGGLQLREIATLMRLSEEGVRRLELAALEKLGPDAEAMLGGREVPESSAPGLQWPDAPPRGTEDFAAELRKREAALGLPRASFQRGERFGEPKGRK